ncbi:MAG: SDR family NAD(P)-dependent oxidoreductase, partial [Hyphomonas sp.]
GLGRAIALSLQADGARVVAAARASADLDTLEIALGDGGSVWAEDATSDALLERIAQAQPFDILVNNAGMNIPQPFEAVTDDALDQLIALNIRSVFRIARSVVRKMGHGGRVINITSQMGHVGSPRRTVYCMTKHAIEGLTKAMAVELAPRGITVNSVAPTFVETPMTATMLADPEFASFVRQMIPMGRLAQAEDVAAAVRYLCSPAAGMVTGHSLRVDGGWTAH